MVVKRKRTRMVEKRQEGMEEIVSFVLMIAVRRLGFKIIIGYVKVQMVRASFFKLSKKRVVRNDSF